MPKEIKNRIVLEGEKEYSQALRDANRNLKTLRSEMKAETAELGANATAQQKAEVRSRNLKRQIEEQEKIVKAYRAALEEVKAKYGDNEEAIALWEQRLNGARATLGNMRNELDGVGASMKGMQTDASAAVVATKSVADAIGEIASVGDSVASSIEGIFTGMVDTIREAVSTVWSMITETAARAGEYNDIASVWNTDAQTVQMWANAVKAAGSDFATLQGNMTKLVMGDHDKIAALTGVSWMGDTDQWQYAMDVLTSISSMDYTRQMEALEVIFGDKRSTGMKNVLDNWARVQELLPTFNGNETGYGLSDEGLDVFDQIGKKIGEIETKWDALKDKIVEGLGVGALGLTISVSGAMDGVADFLSAENEQEREAALQKIRTNLEDFFAKLGEIIQECIGILRDIGTELQTSEDPVTRAVGNILTGITDALQWMVDNQDAVVAAFQAIFGAWLVAKLAAVAGQLTQIVANINAIKMFRTFNTGGNLPGAAPGTGTGVNPGGGGVPATGNASNTLHGGGGATPAGGSGTGANPTPSGAPVNGSGVNPAGVGAGATIAGAAANALWTVGVPAAVLTAGLLPGIMAQRKDEQEWQEAAEAAEAAVQELRTQLGDKYANEIDMLERIAKAAGPETDENGDYVRSAVLGGLVMRDQSDAEAIIQGLSDPQKRGLLHAAIRRHGGSVQGWDPWSLLLRSWGEYTEDTTYGPEMPWKQGQYAGQKRVDMPLEGVERMGLLQYLQELYESELRSAAGTAGNAGFHFPGMAPWGGLSADTWQRGGSSAQEGIIPGDMESFRGLPGAMQNAIREGAKAGVSGIKVVMDGVTVGRLVAPTVSQEIARSMP